MTEASTPGPNALAVGALLAIALPVVALVVSADMGPDEGFMDGFMDDFEVEGGGGGEIALTSLSATRSDRLQGGPRSEVDALVVLRGEDARNVSVAFVLSRQPCPVSGPPGEPETQVDHKVVRRDFLHGTASMDVRLSAFSPPAGPLSLYVRVDAENAVGPVFGECRDLRDASPPEPAFLPGFFGGNTPREHAGTLKY